MNQSLEFGEDVDTQVVSVRIPQFNRPSVWIPPSAPGVTLSN